MGMGVMLGISERAVAIRWSATRSTSTWLVVQPMSSNATIKAAAISFVKEASLNLFIVRIESGEITGRLKRVSYISVCHRPNA